MNVAVVQHPSLGQNDVMSAASAPTICHEPRSQLPITPRRRKVAKNDNNGLTKEMISRAFPKSPSKQRTQSEILLSPCVKNTTNKAMPAGCGSVLSSRRSVSPRRVIRSRSMPLCQKPTVQGSKVLPLINHSSLSKVEKQETVMRKETGPKNSMSDQISTATMKSIADHKSVIADLRPKRRKVQFNKKPIGEDDRKMPSRIHCLSLQDLCIQGNRHAITAPPDLADSYSSLSYYAEMQEGETEMISDNDDKIRKLENKLDRCNGMLTRLDELIEQEKEQSRKIEAENQELRRQLVSSLPTAGNQSKQLTQKQMTNMIDSLEKKLSALDDGTERNMG
jgi:hypothetical protein